jgi:hypothetical protein
MCFAGLTAFAMLFGITGAAQAAEDCGPGWYWNGLQCQPLHVYRPQDSEYWTRLFPEKGYPNCTIEGCCPPGFSIQDKLCKPYRGR